MAKYRVQIYRFREQSTEKFHDTEQIYDQIIEGMDLPRVIRAVNGFDEPETSKPAGYYYGEGFRNPLAKEEKEPNCKEVDG